MSVAARRLASALLAILALATAAHAQTAPAGPFVYGGWSLELRERTALEGVTFGGGVPLTATISIDGSIGWYATKSAEGSFNSPFGSSQTQNADRDVPLAGAIRWSMRCAGRVCADLVGGAGVNFHRVKTRTIVTCPPAGMFLCTERDQASDTNHSEFLITAGVDVRFQLSRHLAVAPGFRIGLPARIGVPAIFPRLGATEDGPYYLVNVTAFYRF